ncbi:MAG: serine/threonine protein kinase, partial [Lentisphaeria bacterium]|nr:serine/threonine protein kinase [Lentisphaeria bacterium]
MTEFHAGDSIAGYTVIGLCGRGAYGEVYRVTDSLGTELALKLLPSGKAAEREIDALIRFRACRHPNLLTILHVGELPGGRVCYTMDLADPQKDTPEYSPDTLSARMTRHSVAPEEAEKILRELLAGLSELHRAHLLHRDIKPANILFIHGRAVLADIGLVTPDASASLIGTPDYLPPELLKNHRTMTAADDCYALGLVLYCMLTGEPPKRFPSVPKTLREPSALRLLKISEKACTSPGFPDAAAFLEELDRPVGSGKKRGAWKWIAIGTGAILAVLAAFAVWRFAVMPGETYTPGNTAILHKTPPLTNSDPYVSFPRTYQWGSSIDAPKLEEARPAAPSPVVYAPEVAALLKKYQLTEAEKTERERRLAPFRKFEAAEDVRLRQQ